MRKDQLFVEEHRELSLREIDLIKWLLVTTNNLEFLEQIEKARVISKCGCGCRTIDLEVVEYVSKFDKLINLDAQGVSPEGVPVDVILHIRHGLISELEIYAMDETEEFSLPEIDKLNVS